MRLLPVMIILAFLAVACTQQPAQPQSPRPEAPAAPPQVISPTAPLPSVENRAPNPNIVKLFDNLDKVKSYSFDIAFLPDERAQYHYDVRGNKAKVTLIEPLNLKGKAGDVVYVDFSQGTAIAYCTRPGICPDTLNQGTPVDFKQFNITLPPQWTSTLQYGSISRTLTFEDMQVTVIDGQEDGRYYQAYVQNFYGMPVRVAIASNPEMTNITGGYEYRSMAFNTAKESDVTPPQ